MHALVYFLIVLLASFFLQLLSPIQIEARNLNFRVLFEADLIRRDSSSISSFYDSSMTLQERQWRASLGSVSLGHNIRLSSSFFDEKDVKTDVIPNGGDYLMKIGVGTPPVEVMVVVDTGSDLTWLQCSPCQRCFQKGSLLFDPTKSSTYHPISCNPQSCNYPELNSGCIPNSFSNNESCVYTAIYGDGTKSTGLLSTETISFPSADATQSTFPSSIIGCGFDQQGRLGIHGDGIVGLGLGTLSLALQLGPNINYKFSYCLTPLSSTVAGKLKFGADVTGPGVVSTPFATTEDSPTFYSLTLNGISVGNSSVPVAQDIIIDSGTTLTFLPTSIYDSIKTAVKGAITVSPVPDPENALDPCYETLPSGVPDVVFHFKGADVVLKAVNTFRIFGNLTCLAIVPSDDSLLFGNVAQVNHQVGYDLKAKQISFAPTDCTKY
ncbi:aspartic proteinase CDR1-like [Chenopodium quinoa]|uniref:aspartic proteinase CDR1-like n=1 Tax=Chenopodium quinoa TaxID=63459 RepID=UPI000B796BDA|nr:aspartic proteinase CDR1-like [Chenopodium quinoa]